MRRPQTNTTDIELDQHDTEVTTLQRSLLLSQAQTRAEQAKVHALTIINESLCEELMEQEQQYQLIQNMAYYDTLTGLPNRNLLLDRFRLALANAVRDQHELAVLFLDINNFKTYNDSYGHSYGDVLLQTIAARVLAVLRASDTVCRYGGDEFVVLLSDVKGTGGAIEVINKIHQALAQPYPSEALPAHSLKTSIGLAMYPEDGNTFTELVRKADLAMYSGKKNYSQHGGVIPIRRITSTATEPSPPLTDFTAPDWAKSEFITSELTTSELAKSDAMTPDATKQQQLQTVAASLLSPNKHD